MSKTSILKVQGKDITIANFHETDYISLTDMVANSDGANSSIGNWLRRKDTLEFLGLWESLNNPNGFKLLDFEEFMKEAGTNRFTISPKQWADKTGAIGIISKSGKNGGTYAHKDIAFEFGSWISPMFKLYLIKEFQRLKDEEAKLLNSEWDYRRFLTKVNYKLHTDAVKEIILPQHIGLTKEQEGYIYANEAEMINLVIFGETAKDWRKSHPKEHLDGHNQRSFATIPQLTVLSNIEVISHHLIKEGLGAKDRFFKLKETAITQLKSLSNYKYTYPIESPYISNYEQTTTFDNNLKGLLNTPPPEKKKKK